MKEPEINPPCVNHPIATADWFCAGCMTNLCRECVSIYSAAGRPLASCKKCGMQCAPIVEPSADEVVAGVNTVEETKTFLERLPEIVRFPLSGFGVAGLIAGALLLGVATLLSRSYAVGSAPPPREPAPWVHDFHRPRHSSP